MFFLVSVSSEVFHRMMSMRALYRRLGMDTSVTRDAPELLRQVRGSFGGRLVLLDWERGRVLADTSLPGATGFALHNGEVIACSWTEQCVYRVNGGIKSDPVTHPWFNYLHSIDVTPRNTWLLASAGSDLIVEVAPSGEIVWEWFGPEHGYDRQPDGAATFFDRAADYRTMKRSTAEQSMHVNSALALSADTVLATLFHQGQLIEINQKTGQPRVLLEGLSRPHGIRRRAGGFLLSDTLGHRIVLLDEELKVCSEVPCGSQWLQDSIPTQAGSYLILENVHIDQLPEPGLTNRIAEIDRAGKRLRGFDVGADHRLFSVREVEETVAHALAEAWGTSGALSQWQWS
jgi:hypothetical protein